MTYYTDEYLIPTHSTVDIPPRRIGRASLDALPNSFYSFIAFTCPSKNSCICAR